MAYRNCIASEMAEDLSNAYTKGKEYALKYEDGYYVIQDDDGDERIVQNGRFFTFKEEHA